MNDADTDRGLRGVFFQNAPDFGERHRAVLDAVHRRGRRRPSSHPVLRLVGIAAAIAVIGFGLGAGVWALVNHLDRGHTVVVITDETVTTLPAAGSAATTTSTPGTSVTATDVTPAPLPLSAWPPDSYPADQYLPSEVSRRLAETVIAHFPDVGLSVSKAEEIRTATGTRPTFKFDLTTPSNGDVWVTLFGVTSPDQLDNVNMTPDTTEAPSIAGAARTILILHPRDLRPDSVDSWQLIAYLPSGVVVNAMSTVTHPGKPGKIPFDKAGLGEFVTYVISVITSKQVELPNLVPDTTTTTQPTIRLDSGLANAALYPPSAYLEGIAYNDKTKFIAYLTPEARDRGAELFAVERAQMKTSGMTGDRLTQIMGQLVVQWRDDAYVTAFGYFVQTKPAVPEDVASWLGGDPANRFAVALTMYDKSVRWFRVIRGSGEAAKMFVVPVTEQ